MKSLTLLVSLIVALSHSASAASKEMARGSVGNLGVALSCDCACEYRQNRCEALRISLPEDQKHKVKNCAQPESEEGLANAQVVGCFHGIYDSTIGSILKIPGTVKKVVQNDQKCNSDPYAKLMLLRTVSFSYEPGMLGTMVRTWTCADIAMEVSHRENLYYQAINEKRTKLLNSSDSDKLLNDEKFLDEKLQTTLTENEKKFLLAKDPKKIEANGGAWNCYTPYERLRLYCDNATTAVTLLAGVVGMSKVAAVQAARAEALELSRVSGVVKQASSGASATGLVSVKDGLKVIDSATRGLKGTSEAQKEAIQTLGRLEIDPKSFGNIPPATYNEKMLGIVETLTKYTSQAPTPELQKAAVEAALRYSRVNSSNYKRGFLGRRAPEVFGELYYDPKLSDDVRRLVHEEMTRAYESAGFGAFPPFRFSAEMQRELDLTGHVSGPRW